MENFLEKVNNYITVNNLELSASIENKPMHKNLVLKNQNAEIKEYKIQELRVLPSVNMTTCHSTMGVMKIDPYEQTDKWMAQILKQEISIKNKVKFK
jgi:hypothetical protein